MIIFLVIDDFITYDKGYSGVGLIAIIFICPYIQ